MTTPGSTMHNTDPANLRLTERLLGYFMLRKARANQADVGTRQAAKNLRKQGVPLPIALAVLCGQFSVRNEPEESLDFSR